MPAERLPFQTRLDLVLAVFGWAALALGTVIAALEGSTTARVVGAAVVSGAWVVAVHAVPSSLRWRPIPGELMAVAGVAASLTAVGLTGGGESPFLLIGLAPTLFAASSLGARVGFETALLSIAGLVVVAAIASEPLVAVPAAISVALQLVVAAAFSQLRRAYRDAEQESAALRRITAETSTRMDRLAAAHDLLLRFSGMTDPAELNPVAAGLEGLARLRETVEFDAGLVAFNGESGPVVVARDGEEVAPHHRMSFPLTARATELGFVVLSRGHDFTEEERVAIGETLKPVELTFANIWLLRDITQRTVREERARLARELHDEIGPSLASLGLALDVALLQYPVEPELSAHLDGLRRSVSNLVDDIRTTVTDLRAESGRTVTQHVRSLAVEAGKDGPKVTVAIDERRPPRPSIVEDVMAVITEALRNAFGHAEAATVRIEGYVDRSEGKLSIVDDGRGFDPTSVGGDRFGLVGMRERAGQIGGACVVESSPGVGTTVSLEWGRQ